MRTADFDYALPEGSIAQKARPRGTSRLLVLDRGSSALRFSRIDALPGLLLPRDLLLANDVRVIPARLRAVRPGGGGAELLLVRPLSHETWEVMARPAKRLRSGAALDLKCGKAIPEERLGDGRWCVRFDPPLDETHLAAVGEVPLPPYISRPGGAAADDAERYQTIYARSGRAVAAPTAGLHFTPELLHAVTSRGVDMTWLTLHVGPGTFRPVQAENPLDHVLDPEDYEISDAAARAVNQAVAAGRRIVCVGTTACRALEHALIAGGGRVRVGPGRADVFITPGYRFCGAGALLTNFHLPRSTLIMLVAAMAGREKVLAAYRAALEHGFAFYSYGDAMLVI